MLNALLVLLLSASPAWCQPQPGGLVGAPFRDFSGGLNDNSDPSAIQANQSPDLLNVVVDDPIGALRPRNGFSECGVTPSGNSPTGLYEYVKSNGTRRLIVTDNVTYWETSDCENFTEIVDDLSSTAYPSFETVRDKLWVTNRSTHVFTWNGTSQTYLKGLAGQPNPAPPICAYLEYWRERVWCARTSSEPSSLQFSALTDSNGDDLDPSTGTVAWPAVNVIYVDRDGGSPIYGLRAYRDNLFVFKENGIWNIDFKNELEVDVVKTLASVGSKFNESIIERDNLLEFVGPDGIYTFDGVNAVRTSDNITNKFKSLTQPSVDETFSIWTSQDDFDAATSTAVLTTSVSPGDVKLATATALLTNGDFETGDTTGWTCVVESSDSSGGSDNGCGVHSGDPPGGLGSVGPIEGTYSAFVSISNPPGSSHNFRIKVVGVDGSTKTDSSDYSLTSIGCSNAATQTIDTSSYAGDVVYMRFVATKGGAAPINILALESSTFTARGDITYKACVQDCNTVCGFAGIDVVKNSEFEEQGQITSDIRDVVEVSTWSTFDVGQELNGGTANYEIRFGTNSGAVEGASWSSIIPGSVINGTTHQTNVQWRATIIAPSDRKNTPVLSDVTLNFIQGDISSSRIYGMRWDNRYLVSATSGSATSNNLVLMRSKNPLTSWTPHDLQIGPMVQYGDSFYAGASTHSAIYIMEQGTNDNGKAINWYWTSRDEFFGDPTRYKRLLELQTDFRKGSAANAKIGFSRDYGTTWTERTVNMSGTGHGSSRQHIDGRNIDFRFRIRDSTIDEKATILGITGWARPEFRRQ